MAAIHDRLDVNASEMLNRIAENIIIQADNEEEIYEDCIAHVRLQKLRERMRKYPQYSARKEMTPIRKN